MEFYDFNSSNLELPGSHKGAFAALGLSLGDNFVRIIRCQNGDPATGTKDGVFEVNYLDQGQIKWVHLNRSTTTSNLQQDLVFAAKRHKIRKVLTFPLLRSPCAFLWLIVLLSAFTDDKKTIRLNSDDTAFI